MASVTSYRTSTGEHRWRARVRLRGHDISHTFLRRTEAHKWARMLEFEIVNIHLSYPLYMHHFNPRGKDIARNY